MLTKLLRSFLNIAENPRSLPKFFSIYVLLWLIWHYQFIISFGFAAGNLKERLDIALAAIDGVHFLSVFWLTVMLFLFHSAFQVFIKYSREHVDKKDREENDQLSELDKKKDMEQLVATLATLQKELKISQENEKQAKADVKDMMVKLMAVQIKLDETTADLEILQNTQNA